MKVLYVAPQYPNLGRNAAQVRANALLGRVSRKFEMHVIAFPVLDGNTHLPAGESVQTLSRRTMTPLQLALGTLSPLPRAFRRFDTAEARTALRRELDSFRPDVLHFDTLATLGLLDAAASARTKPAIVAHTHDAVSRQYKARTRYRGPLYRADKWREYRKIVQFEARTLSRCDLVLVDSPEDAAYLTNLMGRQTVETLPLGFDPESLSPDGPVAEVQSPALVFSGSFASDQSADATEFLVHEIMPRVWQRQPGTHLYLVGANPPDTIRALSSSHVHVTGFVDDIATYLRAASVYVCPLRLGSGMRTRVVEALACGAPMVATPMAVRGLTVPEERPPPWHTANSADEFAETIARLLSRDNSCLRERAARYAKENYSWDGVVDQLGRFYERLAFGREIAG